MKHYIDGFVLCVPKNKVAAYRKMSELAGKVWMEHGALQYVEAIGNDFHGMPEALGFPKMARAKKGEAIMFSWIMYNNKAHRNAVNAKVIKDKRLDNYADKPMPFDMKRMAYGGFVTIVDKKRK
ncbi:MAG TPA: DUF1428 family protein [Candidatus Nanoarchaeia archaeon]|nr:DUF1428 family protein [Candidatus Nanoarchaeia archaeon]